MGLAMRLAAFWHIRCNIVALVGNNDDVDVGTKSGGHQWCEGLEDRGGIEDHQRRKRHEGTRWPYGNVIQIGNARIDRSHRLPENGTTKPQRHLRCLFGAESLKTSKYSSSVPCAAHLQIRADHPVPSLPPRTTLLHAPLPNGCGNGWAATYQRYDQGPCRKSVSLARPSHAGASTYTYSTCPWTPLLGSLCGSRPIWAS
ncbi:uncharacterized protein K452DRAFT_26103 [Aplosporella prunicola CBS 121167]|uniref:Secreted protein n=1 Tax=Aplosporella prunicola CBS 121167 TaxID=1176127 RepID=A0A6A6BFQ7_9PEZI|nr:uncharacterized protein K452DRAFT_26103 [Aplosporella prunicola CBS 121167]KAF2142074.1 hypothetical protein K452DRAFT_26103 [Aplosporella prunicola CBS 121167]